MGLPGPDARHRGRRTSQRGRVRAAVGSRSGRGFFFRSENDGKDIEMKRIVLAGLAVCVAAALSGCGDTAQLPVSAGVGPKPTLPPPTRTLIPTVHIAPAKGWPAGAKPVAAAGTAVSAFATGLDHPRWVYVLPNGDVLVAETNAPPRPDDGKGIKGWVMKLVMKKAGAGVPSANRITLLRDADGDGVAETRTRLPRGSQFAVRHGARRRRPLRRQHRRGRALSLQRRARRRSPRPAPRSPTCRPARSTTTGPRTHRQPRRLASST